ncbi:TetR/AcrR family transcriptional regulator [Arthrobacter sp. FW305-BF8]|uniref:TetR/AcrR family transcriptional regulator n=1 Tax=Arthrobacter sp. FW305-BF8 TaxID=2879617 RepID=UPI001F30EABA|nr:TetR/AcrR family transcriptional regulator [Arthrobacter sp. FW305-BF8]UKA56377.1 TetR/AcrR family transcriptional regulator [Arthrobacter sp. FW305-BF8]
MKRRPARASLLEAAARLFYADGVSATGIDSITAAAGVAKKSLYNNFTSKADLVAAYLAARHEEWLTLYRGRVAAAATPRERVLAVFDAYIDHANFAYEHGFRGCGLLNAAAELPAGAPGRQAVRQHKEEVEGLLRKHVAELLRGQDKTAARVARHLAFLLEGSMARAGLEGEDGCLQEARMIAAQMLEQL